MIDQVWRTILGADDPNSPLVAADDADEVVELLIESKLDPQKFGGNGEAFVQARSMQFDARPATRSPLPTTHSIHKLKTGSYNQRIVPLWMVAGFPDVMCWFIEAQSNGDNVDTLMRLPADGDVSEEGVRVANADGTIRARYWRNLVLEYATRTGKGYEVAVDEGTDNDVYAASAVLGMMGEDSNFTLVASRATKYYVELQRSYGSAFPTASSLLAMSGMLTGIMYVVGLQKVSCSEVVAIADGTEGTTDRLLEFVIRLESLLFAVDNPELPVAEVAEACEGQRDAIQRTIRRTVDTFQSEPGVANDVRTVMNSRNYAIFRKAASVKPATVLGKLRGMFGG